MAVEKNQVQDMYEMISEMKNELDALRAEKKAQEMLKKAEEEAEARAKRLVEAEEKEMEAIKGIVEKLTAEKVEQFRAEKKIEFPVTLRAGNLSKADKQLLDIIKGTKVLEYDAYGTKSVITTSTATEWNPTDLANEILRNKTALTRVRGTFRVINMTSNPFKVPVRTGPADVTAATEGAAITENATDFVSNVTLTAYKLAANVPVSTEEGEDAIISVIPEIKMAIAEGLAKAEDEFFLNATVNGNAVSGAGSGIAGAAGTVQSAGAAGTTDATQTQFDTAWNTAIRQMGIWGIDPSELVFFCGTLTYYKLLYTNTNIQQISQYGDKAVLLTGEVARYKGIPVVVTSGVRAVFDGGANTTYTEKNLIVNKNAVILGDRRTLTIKSMEYVDQDIVKLVGTERTAYAVPFTAGVAQIATHLTLT